MSRCVVADTRALDNVDVLSAIRAEGGDARRGDFQRFGPLHLGLVLTRRGRRVLARHGQADLVRSQGSAAGREERTLKMLEAIPAWLVRIVLPLLAWLASRVAPEFGVLAGFLLSGWVAFAVFKQLSVPDADSRKMP